MPVRLLCFLVDAIISGTCGSVRIVLLLVFLFVCLFVCFFVGGGGLFIHMSILWIRVST